MKRQLAIPDEGQPSKRLLLHKSENTADDKRDTPYFGCYSKVGIHIAMVMDRSRCLAYRQALHWACAHLNKPVVADVGSGCGILSLMAAQAGARRVYALEAARGAQKLCASMLTHNNATVDGQDQIIRLMRGTAETADLPEMVDVVVSEWMGHALLYERMLPSVLKFRDRWLKPGGLLLPCTAHLHLSSLRRDEEEELSRAELNEQWSSIEHDYGMINFAPLRAAARIEEESIAQVTTVSSTSLVSNSIRLATLDLTKIHECDLKLVGGPFELLCLGDARVVALVLWFVVDFPSDIGGEIGLDTGPLSSSGSTHWQQTRLELAVPLEVKQGAKLRGELHLECGDDDTRGLSVRLTRLEYCPNKSSDANDTVLFEQIWSMKDG